MTTIANLKEHVGEEISLNCWLYNKTGKGKLQFLQVRDGTGRCQAVVFKGNVSEEDFDAGKELTQESSLRLTGTVKAEERAPGIPGGFELDVTSLKSNRSPSHIPSRPKSMASNS